MFSPDLTINYPEAIKFLTNAINQNKLANSYIFISKDTKDTLLLATDLAKILNCEKNKTAYSSPCNVCINCRWLSKNENPQALIAINPDTKSKKEQIKIDIIRELLNTLNTTSSFFRVIFFQKANLYTLPAESSNLLLKTVEEAHGRTLFIFTSETRGDILPTILSRSQIIYLCKKLNSITEVIDYKNTELNNDLTDCFSSNLLSCIEKKNKAQEYLSKNDIGLKDFLGNLAIINYEKHKYESSKIYCNLYENINSAYLKHNSFMQEKIVLEDLYLKLSK